MIDDGEACRWRIGRWLWVFAGLAVAVVVVGAVRSGTLERPAPRNSIAAPERTGHPDAMANGTVKFFDAEQGWGAISSSDLPPGLDAWVHFSAIEMAGYRFLEAGDRVEFDYEQGQQDGYSYRATRVRKL